MGGRCWDRAPPWADPAWIQKVLKGHSLTEPGLAGRLVAGVGQGACGAGRKVLLEDRATHTIFANSCDLFRNENNVNFLPFSSGQNVPRYPETDLLLGSWILNPPLPSPRLGTVWEACGSAMVCKAQEPISHPSLSSGTKPASHAQAHKDPRRENARWPHSLSHLGGILFHALQISSWGNFLSSPFPFCSPVLESPCPLRRAKIKSLTPQHLPYIFSWGASIYLLKLRLCRESSCLRFSSSVL